MKKLIIVITTLSMMMGMIVSQFLRSKVPYKIHQSYIIHRNLRERAEQGVFFYVIIGLIIIGCGAYNICFKRRLEAEILRQQTTQHEQLHRHDVIASDENMDNLWECDICAFRSYSSQKVCMLCGTERGFKLNSHIIKDPSKSSKFKVSNNYILQNNNNTNALAPLTSSQSQLTLALTPTADKLNAAYSLLDIKNDKSFNKNGRRKTFLAALNSRQLTARRRHEWKRTVNEDGRLVWMRKKENLVRNDSNSNSSNSLRDSVSSDSSIGYASRLIFSPTAPCGKMNFEEANGADINRTNIHLTNYDELETVAKLPFQQKYAWFVQHLALLEIPWEYGHLLLEIDRKNLLHSSCEKVLWASTKQFHQSLRIKFINEVGVDAGGLEREWFTLMIKEIFNDTNGLFINYNNTNEYTINVLSEIFSEDHLMYYQAIGRFLGKALFEGILIEAHIIMPIYKHILGIPITFSDLQFVDYEVYKHLKHIKDNKNVVKTLCLDFTITIILQDGIINDADKYMDVIKHYKNSDIYKNTYVPGADDPSIWLGHEISEEPLTTYKKNYILVDLVPNGRNIPVTEENKDVYVKLRFQWIMLSSISAQLASLIKGLYTVIPSDYLSIFDHQELELLMCGIPDIDVQDWKNHTSYITFSHNIRNNDNCMNQNILRNHQVVQWFWEIVSDFSSEHKAKLLQFITGSARVPVQGFKALTMNDGRICRFTIQLVKKEECMYPRAHTCFNRLDLPNYEKKKDIELALNLVIKTEVTGFTIE